MVDIEDIYYSKGYCIISTDYSKYEILGEGYFEEDGEGFGLE